MDVINAEKLFAIKYCYKKSQLFLYNLNIFHSLIFLFFTYWLSSQSHYFPPDTISSIIKMVATPPSFFSPSCLFVIVNFIVVYIVGEQKLTGAKSAFMNTMYDEYYIERTLEMKYLNPCENMKELVVEKFVEEKEEEGISPIEDDNGIGFSEKENEGDCKLANEELNKRAEAFIARVNKQRKLEAVDCFSC
uniref:DUF4408 domain-containing protein n=1 Tax=Cucumis sativus TaxID=3659 RepID=A0A0A0K9L0_CUCSA